MVLLTGYKKLTIFIHVPDLNSFFPATNNSNICGETILLNNRLQLLEDTAERKKKVLSI